MSENKDNGQIPESEWDWLQRVAAMTRQERHEYASELERAAAIIRAADAQVSKGEDLAAHFAKSLEGMTPDQIKTLADDLETRLKVIRAGSKPAKVKSRRPKIQLSPARKTWTPDPN